MGGATRSIGEFVVAFGLALSTTGCPAAAYAIEALTSISTGVAADKPSLDRR